MPVTSSKIGVWNRALARIGHTRRVQSETEQSEEVEACDFAYDDILREVLEDRDWNWATFSRPITQIDTRSTNYTGDDTTTDFNIPYGFLDNTQLTVTVDGTEQTVGTDFTVTPAADGVEAFLSFTTAPASSEAIVITVAYSREGWDHVYALPADFLKPIALLTDGERVELTPESQQQEWDIQPADDGEGFILCTDLDTGDFDVLEYVALQEYVLLWPRRFLDAVVTRLAVELALAIPKDMAKAERFMAAYEESVSRAWARDQATRKTSQTPATPSLTARG